MQIKCHIFGCKYERLSARHKYCEKHSKSRKKYKSDIEMIRLIDKDLLDEKKQTIDNQLNEIGDFLKVSEVADLLRLNHQVVRKWIRNRDINSIKIFGTRRIIKESLRRKLYADNGITE